MTKTFVVSDTHFGHRGVCQFLREDGTKLRPWDNPEDMDEALVENWNSVVSDGDRVYHLGDVAINRRCLATLGRLKGRKCLVKGNHDIFKLKDYTKYFDDIRAYVVAKYNDRNVIFSHVPIHPDSLGRFSHNVHGHLHAGRVMDHYYDLAPEKKPDLRYINVCVEWTNYTPVETYKLFEKSDDR